MLAHQGGWDEILLVLGPIVVVIGLLAVARRRLAGTEPATAEQTTGAPDAPTDGRPDAVDDGVTPPSETG